MCEGDHGIFSEGKFMSILDKSSLVMIPSGYKEDVLYSVKPRNGEGDFTFTRASTGTRVNAEGFIEEVPWNLNNNSENLNSYTKLNVVVTSDDIISPRGTQDADKLETTSNNSYKLLKTNSVSFVSGVDYTFSFHAKKGTTDFIQLITTNTLFGATSEWANFDLNNGVVSLDNYGGASIEDIGDGWYRCKMTSTCVSSGTDGWYVSVITSGTSTRAETTSNVVDVYIWGVQLVKGTSLKPYIKTTDRLDIPRLDYSGGATTPTLLLEGQRTNYIAYSEDYTSGTWNTSNTTITPNSIIAPSGLNVGSLITANGTNPRLTYNVGVGTGSFVFSWFAKKGTSSYLKIRVYDGSTNHDAIFDLETGTLTSGNGIIEPYENDWYRCSLIYTSNGYTHFTQTWISNTSSGNLYLWGAMLEKGSFPTSYMMH